MRNLEQELKLQLTQREYNILSKVANVDAVEQINYYFATEKLDKTTMIRLRQKNGVYLLCCKKRLTNANDVMVSAEQEQEIDGGYAQKLIQRGITAKELNNFFRLEFDENYNFIGTLTTFRTKFKLEEWTIELDKNFYFDCLDYELECESNQVQSLAKLKNYLTYTYGIVVRSSSTKFERFLTALQNKGNN